MNFVPTTTVSVLRGTGTDEYGDPVDVATVVATGLPASILERVQRVARADSGSPQVVTYFTARLNGDVSLQSGDRIEDERTGHIYVMDNFSQVASPIRINPVRLDLRRVA